MPIRNDNIPCIDKREIEKIEEVADAFVPEFCKRTELGVLRSEARNHAGRLNELRKQEVRCFQIILLDGGVEEVLPRRLIKNARTDADEQVVTLGEVHVLIEGLHVVRRRAHVGLELGGAVNTALPYLLNGECSLSELRAPVNSQAFTAHVIGEPGWRRLVDQERRQSDREARGGRGPRIRCGRRRRVGAGCRS
eukprot:3325420-Prymnesium_polylepis.1